MIYAKTTFFNFYLENYLSNKKISNKKDIPRLEEQSLIFYFEFSCISTFYWLLGKYCPVQASRPLIRSGHWIVKNKLGKKFNTCVSHRVCTICVPIILHTILNSSFGSGRALISFVLQGLDLEALQVKGIYTQDRFFEVTYLNSQAAPDNVSKRSGHCNL